MYDDLLWAVLEAIPQIVLANWPLFAVVGGILLVTWALELARRRRLARSGIAEIDQMDGKTFEQRLAILFHKLGYRVEQTRYRGDYGADLVISKDGVKTVVQAKRYAKNVGLAAVQQVVAAKAKYGCTAAMVVTNRAYTKPARTLAEANKVELWDRDRLVQALLSVQQ